MNLNDYPNLRKAAIEIGYDNGRINRYTPERVWADECWNRLVEAKISVYAMALAEAQMSVLGVDAFSEVCNVPREDWTHGQLISDSTDRVLNIMFDGG